MSLLVERSFAAFGGSCAPGSRDLLPHVSTKFSCALATCTSSFVMVSSFTLHEHLAVTACNCMFAHGSQTQTNSSTDYHTQFTIIPVPNMDDFRPSIIIQNWLIIANHAKIIRI